MTIRRHHNATGSAGLLLFCLGFLAVAGPGRANTWPRLEAAFNLSGIASPYDHTVADVRVQLKLPDSSTLSLPAFYDGGTSWKLRHAPRSAGAYLYEVAAEVASGVWDSGPACTTEMVADNFNGTETVTVIVNASATAEGYFRLRISQL